MTNSFLSKIRTGLKIIDRPWFYPIILLFVGLVTYGIIFTRPGFFWDDWGKVYLYYTHNPVVSLHYSPSRPYTVWVYLFLFTFAKMTPIVWQIVELIVRWLGILFIYYTLNAIWPNRVSREPSMYAPRPCAKPPTMKSFGKRSRKAGYRSSAPIIVASISRTRRRWVSPTLRKFPTVPRAWRTAWPFFIHTE